MSLSSMKFQKLQKAFLSFARDQNISREELATPAHFFQAPQVQELIAYGAEHNEWLGEIVKGFANMGEMDVYRGCLTGYLIGLYGESGIADEETDSVMADYFVRVLKLCMGYLGEACSQLGLTSEQFTQQEDDPMESVDFEAILASCPDVAKAWSGMGMIALGLMSRISRSRAMRDKLRVDPGVREACETLGDYLSNVGFVVWVLDMVEEEKVILLAPKQGRGVEVSLEQIDSNNVFFTLLQFALYHKGLLEPLGAGDFTYQEVIERLAKHDPVDEEEIPETIYQAGCFGYYTYPALREDGSYHQMGPVWGEGNLREVPKLDGCYVILLDKPTIHRTWSQAFVMSTHPALRPRVEILRELDTPEVTQWMEKVKAANREHPLQVQ